MIIALFAALTEVVIIIVNIFVYKSLVLLLGISNPNVLVLLKTCFVIGSLAFTATSLMAIHWRNRVLGVVYALAGYWLAGLYFFAIGSVLGVFFAALFPSSIIYPHNIYIILYIIAGLTAIYSFINPLFIRIKNVSLTVKDLPEYWKTERLVFISDLHLGPIHKKNFSRKIVKKVSSISPAALLIGGDLFDGTAVDAEEVLIPFSGLSLKHGSYFISGNHEEFKGEIENKFIKAINKTGIKILHNQSVNINGLTISGVDFHDTRKSELFSKVLGRMKRNINAPSILLKHVPADLNIAADAGFSAVFCGHTHNGQVFPFGKLAKLSYGYNYGLDFLKEMQIYVSSGVGTWGPASRLGTSSEIVVIDFKEK